MLLRSCLFLVFAHASVGQLNFRSDRIGAGRQTDTPDCPADQVTFEIVTGYVYTAPADMLDSQPGTLMLTDCIDTCRSNSSCRAINYETGLCVLFSSNADDNAGQLTPSQFPVFTIYVQKNCLPSAGQCDAAWSFERVMGHVLDAEVRKRGKVESRQECMELCLNEGDFECRSANYNSETGDCRLSEMDRHSLKGLPVFTAAAETEDYLEINCVDDPKRLCIYDTTRGKILKTVDSVYQAISSREDCEDLCNNAPFRCHSYDFNDTGDNVCRLSHHSAQTLIHIEEPYLDIPEATTYELAACYNVSIDCHSGDMTANIQTTSLFDGKIYAKGSPLTCVVDIEDQMDFSITMGYNDLECGVEKEGPGSYTNDVIIQHHDRIVTSQDLGLSLSCQYDLANKSVSNTVDLAITGEITPSLYEEAVVDSPNVAMRVTDQQGADTKTAVVGDPLAMVFEILDQDSPYEIFVRDLIAVDGATDTELVLIDSRGCPAEPTIMSELRKSEPSPKILISNFDAFRFPSSDMVQFRAMVTPCMPVCEPVQCDVLDYTGQTRVVESYGKRRKRSVETALERWGRQKRTTEPEEVLVKQTLHIVDRYGKRNEQARLSHGHNNKNDESGYSFDSTSANAAPSDVFHEVDIDSCLDQTSLISGVIVFLAIQAFLLILWTLLWKKKRNEQAKEVIMPPESSTDSLSYLYETGFTRRLQ